MAKVQNDVTAFVKAWEAAENTEAAAKTLGITKGSAAARASALRAKGVQLKFMQRGSGGGSTAKIDVNSVNALLAELRGISADDMAKLVAESAAKREAAKAAKAAETTQAPEVTPPADTAPAA